MSALSYMVATASPVQLLALAFAFFCLGWVTAFAVVLATGPRK